MFKRACVLGLAAMLLAGCDDPSDYLPKAYAPPAPSPPTAGALAGLRQALGPCEAAMDAAADPIGRLAAGGKASTEGREMISRAHLVCDGAAAQIQAMDIWGRLKDPCVRAAHAREVVAAGALDVLDVRGTRLGVPALRDKIGDQVAISRTCAGEIAAADRAVLAD